MTRTGLEIHHVEAWAKCRNHDENKQKCFCKPHNLLEAEREFGATFIRNRYASD